MTDPLRILHVSPSFYPAIAYGGPIYSTKAITDGIARSPGFSVNVLSTDTADPNSKARLDLSENTLMMPQGYQVRYCRSLAGGSVSLGLLLHLWTEIRRADLVHLTGPYNFPVIPTLLLCRLNGKPLVWSPRGGFQATAQWSGTPKRRTKDAFEKLCAALAPRRMAFHVTAPEEAEASSRNFPGVHCALIPNAVDMPITVPARTWRPDGRLRLAFLSRLHPKKGLDILLAALADLPAHVTLEVYGDGEATHVDALKAKIAQDGLTNRVRFHGSVHGEAKTRAFVECDLFVLPTHSENFGIVVAEALAHGTPVITTVNAPWNGLELHGCGLWTKATAPALAEAVRALENADLAAMGERGRAWMDAEFSSASMITQFEWLYRDMVARPLGQLG
jgi:glycosyltransferase involved in cell wall biosynthesis